VHACLLQKRLQCNLPTCSEVPALLAASEVLASDWDSIAKPDVLNNAASSASFELALG